jgi:hypothetical protein
MADTPADQQPVMQPTERGVAIMVSYQKLLGIEGAMAEIKAMLVATLALQGQVTDHEKRIQNLELLSATSTGAKAYRNTLLVFFSGLVTAALGGGAFYFLPVLWGGTPLTH